MSMSVVDLGTRFGTSIASFLHKSSTFFPNQSQLGTPDFECIGVDIDEIHRGDLEGRGYRFMCGDLRSHGFRESLPEADFYLVCNLLHHLRSPRDQSDVLCCALEKARRGVWFRAKSFEEDATSGEGVLISEGLRFCWSRDYSSYSISEITALVRETLPEASLRVEPAKRIRHTKDKRVVPADTKTDSFFYAAAMGPKVYMELPKPVVCEWDIFVENKIYETNTDKT